MRFLVFFSTLIATSLGIRWDDFRGGDVQLPAKQKDCEATKWRLVAKDVELEISWFAHPDDDSLFVAYDKLGNCAGVRFTISKDDIDDDYLHLYSNKNFEEIEVLGKKVYVSTVLFSDERILKHGGREMLDTEEVALGCYLKGGNSYKMLAREGCRQIKAPFFEQGCHSGYGLVLSSFEDEKKCNSLPSFYAIYDPEDRGNLLGFGWLVIGKTPKSTVFCKPITAAAKEALFQKASNCLTEAITTVEVWLSYRDSLKTKCSEGSWIKSNCKRTSRRHDKAKEDKKGHDSSSSSSSESSDSSSGSKEKKSWWQKLWG